MKWYFFVPVKNQLTRRVPQPSMLTKKEVFWSMSIILRNITCIWWIVRLLCPHHIGKTFAVHAILKYTLMSTNILNIQEKFRFAARVVPMPTDNAISALRLLPLFLREVNLLWTHDEYFSNTCEIFFKYTLNGFGVHVEHFSNTC